MESIHQKIYLIYLVHNMYQQIDKGNEMLTTAEVCAQFNIALKTIQNPKTRNRMGLKGYLQNRRLYFRRSEVEEWEKHRQENDGRRNNNYGDIYTVTIVIPTSIKSEEAIELIYKKDPSVLKTQYGFKIKKKT